MIYTITVKNCWKLRIYSFSRSFSSDIHREKMSEWRKAIRL